MLDLYIWVGIFIPASYFVHLCSSTPDILRQLTQFLVVIPALVFGCNNIFFFIVIASGDSDRAYSETYVVNSSKTVVIFFFK